MVIPLARKSRISETQMRWPLMQGLPKQMLGSMEMRDSSSGFMVFIDKIRERMSERIAFG